MKCAVCQDTAVRPCTVPCGNSHVFCLTCLQGIIIHNHRRRHFPCPLCRVRVPIPPGGAAVFKNVKGFKDRVRSLIPKPCYGRPLSDDSAWPSELLDEMQAALESDHLTSNGFFGLGLDPDDLSLDSFYDEAIEVDSILLRHSQLQSRIQALLTDDESDGSLLGDIMEENQESLSGDRENLVRPSPDQNEGVDRSAASVPVPPEAPELDITIVMQVILNIERNDQRRKAAEIESSLAGRSDEKTNQEQKDNEVDNEAPNHDEAFAFGLPVSAVTSSTAKSKKSTSFVPQEEEPDFEGMDRQALLRSSSTTDSESPEEEDISPEELLIRLREAEAESLEKRALALRQEISDLRTNSSGLLGAEKAELERGKQKQSGTTKGSGSSDQERLIKHLAPVAQEA